MARSRHIIRVELSRRRWLRPLWNLNGGLFLEDMGAVGRSTGTVRVTSTHCSAALDPKHVLHALPRFSTVPRLCFRVHQCGSAAHQLTGTVMAPGHACLYLALSSGSILHQRWWTATPVRKQWHDHQWLPTPRTDVDALVGRVLAVVACRRRSSTEREEVP